MNDAEVEVLRAAMKLGIVLWYQYAGAPAIEVVRIGKDPIPESPTYVPEPGPVAFLHHGLGGSYVALHNCELKEFVLGNRLHT